MARNRQLTEKRILDAAHALLAGDGFENWGVNEVARRAGTDKVLIYRYYNSLDGLLTAVIQSTDFWPDPALLPEQSPEAFIEATLDFLSNHPQARALLAHPGAQSAASSIRRKFSDDLDRWLAGLQSHVQGSISSNQLERLPALIHFQISTGMQNLSPHDLWQQVSPPLDWSTRNEWSANEELPTELL
jgi:AcrR family transcriptional regulator